MRLSGSMRLVFAPFLALAVVACGGSSPPPVASVEAPTPAPTPAEATACEATAAKMTSPPGRGPDDLVGFEDKYRAALVASCTEDAWPDEIHRCVAAASNGDETARCEESLDDDRRARVAERLAPVWDEVYSQDSGGS